MPRATAGTPPLGELDAASAARLAGTAGDVALVLDDQGAVLDVLAGGIELPERELRRWRGQAWADTVTAESRPKIEQLLADARDSGDPAPPRWRQVNHTLPGHEDVPVLYTTVRLPVRSGGTGTHPGIVAIGRDLRAVVTLQRRLVEAQQALEREYWRFREAETRYRHLFDVSSEPVLIIDAATQRIVEANPAARALCAGARSRLVGSPIGSLFDAAHGPRVQDLLAAARSIGRQAPVPLQLAAGSAVQVSASMYRQDDAAFVLLRLLPPPQVAGVGGRGFAAAAAPGAAEPPTALLQGFVEHSPDGLVFCDHAGVVLSANPAFLTLVQMGSESQVRGQPLDRWVGRTGVEIGVLIGNLRQRGTVGLFQTSIRGEFGARTEVEVTGAVVPTAEGGVLAFAVRDIERRLRPEAAGSPPTLQRSAAELAELVGRTPLKEIVAETTDLIEQLCIQTALQMTGDNRASAAQLLGLSRQSLYVKLRRYGLSDSPEPAETP